MDGAIRNRGIERREIFIDDKDREDFLRRLADGLKETKDVWNKQITR